MLKNKKLIFGIAIFFLIVFGGVAFVLNKYQIRIYEKPKDSPLPSLSEPKTASDKCGIENCHGLDITCGSDVPQACDFMYALGDRCRQYARCEVVNGKCQLIKSIKFDECKSCVEKCLENFKDDMPKASYCESECVE